MGNGNYTSGEIYTILRLNTDIYLGGVRQQSYYVPLHGSIRVSLAGMNNGPVKLINTDGTPMIAAERVIYKINGVNTSFTEMMGLPDSQLDTTYWLPWYNNIDLDTQLRFANVSSSTASVHVFIGGQEMTGSPFTLAPGDEHAQELSRVKGGPVKIVSNVNIVAAERVIYKVNGVNTSFSEMMALPNSQLDTTYWLPWYNNVDLDTQLRFGECERFTGHGACLHRWAGDDQRQSLHPGWLGESLRVSFAGVNEGPVKIESDVNIVAAERVIYKVNGSHTSFSEMMALPNSQLDTTYWLPWYNNVDLDTQLRFANVSGYTSHGACLHRWGGDDRQSLHAGCRARALRKSFAGINNGPVQIVSNVPSWRRSGVIYKVNNVATSFSEMMALPERPAGHVPTGCPGTTTSIWIPSCDLGYHKTSLHLQKSCLSEFSRLVLEPAARIGFKARSCWHAWLAERIVSRGVVCHSVVCFLS